ncbi:MAG: hypothetical protein KDB99_13865 [Chitinophagaceae bacterium]|nr:hypothetical protein [Chitinophagaceae bacterium]
MGIFKKLSGYILPKEVDFFGNLYSQCVLTQQVVSMLQDIYITKSKSTDQLESIIEKSGSLRKQNLVELNSVMITPVDKEAISRMYLSLDWIVLSIKHLNAEITAYNISSLEEYEKIIVMLHAEMKEMEKCFSLLKEKKFADVLTGVNVIIATDDELINEYSTQLALLITSEDIKHIIRYKDILAQLKEVSKRIHVTANSIQDIVFKLN